MLSIVYNSANNNALDIYNTNTGGHDWQIGDNIGAGCPAGTLCFDDYTVGSQRMAISPTGNVGIGTASPATALDVYGVIAADGSSVITSNPPTVGTNNGWKIGLSGTSAAIGIAAWTVAVKGSNWLSYFGSGNPANNGTGSTPDTNAVVSFSASGNGLFSGSVGIGTTSPQSLVQAYNGEVQVGSSGASCTSSNAGAIRYSSGSMYYCSGSAWTFFNSCSQVLPYVNTNGGANGSFSAATYPAAGMWGDGTYLYAGAGGSLEDLDAFSFNNSTHAWTNVTHTTPAGFITGNIWGDGTYIYLPQGTTGIQAYKFNGTSFTSKGTYTTSMDANWIWGNGTNIFVADESNGVKAFTFNGSAFTLKSTKTGPQAAVVWGDGTYIYVIDDSGDALYAYTFSGTTWTQKGTISAGGGEPTALWGDGTYIYVGIGGAVEAYTFNGTTFTLKGTFNTPDWSPNLIWGKGSDVYIGGFGIEVVSFNGASFTYKGSILENYVSTGLWADTNNVYFTDGTGQYVAAYPLCN
jgi:hypothetical protein